MTADRGTSQNGPVSRRRPITMQSVHRHPGRLSRRGHSHAQRQLMSAGLPDLRGALGFGFDEASWIPTVLNMGMMFIGVFAVFLGACLWHPARADGHRSGFHRGVVSAAFLAEFRRRCWHLRGDRGNAVGIFLYADADVRRAQSAAETDPLRHRRLCAGYRRHQQPRRSHPRLVHGPSLLALDLLDAARCSCQSSWSASISELPPARPRAAAELARISLHERRAEPDLRRAGSRPAIGLVEFGNIRRHAGRRDLAAAGRARATAISTRIHW